MFSTALLNASTTNGNSPTRKGNSLGLDANFDNMKQEVGRQFFAPEHKPNIPLMYGIVAIKK